MMQMAIAYGPFAVREEDDTGDYSLLTADVLCCGRQMWE